MARKGGRKRKRRAARDTITEGIKRIFFGAVSRVVAATQSTSATGVPKFNPGVFFIMLTLSSLVMSHGYV